MWKFTLFPLHTWYSCQYRQVGFLFPSCSCLLITKWLLKLKTLYLHIHVPSTKKEEVMPLLSESKSFLSADFHLYLNGQNWIRQSLLAAARPGNWEYGLCQSIQWDGQGERVWDDRGIFQLMSATLKNVRKKKNQKQSKNPRNYPCSQEVYILVPEIKRST